MLVHRGNRRTFSPNAVCCNEIIDLAPNGYAIEPILGHRKYHNCNLPFDVDVDFMRTTKPISGNFSVKFSIWERFKALCRGCQLDFDNRVIVALGDVPFIYRKKIYVDVLKLDKVWYVNSVQGYLNLKKDGWNTKLTVPRH